MKKAPNKFFLGRYFKTGAAALYAILILLGSQANIFAQQTVTENRPNIIVIYTDDHRWDALGKSGNDIIKTPNLDKMVETGRYFPNSFVTLSICTPSRAAFLTGQYGSSNQVLNQRLNEVDPQIKTIAEHLKEAGYNTSVFGKWHLLNSPGSMGFDYEYYFHGLAPYWDVPFIFNGSKVETSGFVEDVIVEGAVTYLKEQEDNDRPFFMWLNTWAPHMDVDFSWPAKGKTLSQYPIERMKLPDNWPPDFSDKPPYIQDNRPHQRALYYGYSKEYPLKHHIRGYYAATSDMDAALGKFLHSLSKSGLSDNTYIFLMGDNGWFMGEHGLTSKVLAYEESIRVPLIVNGPDVKTGVSENLMMNIDLMPTVLDLASIEIPPELHGRSFKKLLIDGNDEAGNWRDYIFYEAPLPQHGTQPLYAVRTSEWKLIQTFDKDDPDKLIFEELYNIKNDPNEKVNLVSEKDSESILELLRDRMNEKIAWSENNRFNEP